MTYQTLAAVPEPENSEMFAALVLQSESPGTQSNEKLLPGLPSV